MATKAAELLKKRDEKAGQIGNIVDKECHVSLTEVNFCVRVIPRADARQDDNPIRRVWHPEPNHKGNSPPGLQAEDKQEGIISHHEILARLEAYDTDRGELVQAQSWWELM